MSIVVIGTLDTKGVEVAFVRDVLHSAGLTTLVIDAGVLQPPHLKPDISREEVFAAAGTSLQAVQQAADRGRAIEAAARGVAKIAVDLFNQGKVDGVLGLGGSCSLMSRSISARPAACSSFRENGTVPVSSSYRMAPSA